MVVHACITFITSSLAAHCSFINHGEFYFFEKRKFITANNNNNNNSSFVRSFLLRHIYFSIVIIFLCKIQTPFLRDWARLKSLSRKDTQSDNGPQGTSAIFRSLSKLLFGL